MIQSETQVGKNICVLAQACQLYDYCPHQVVHHLRGATDGGQAPFSIFEKSLLKAQKVFNECVQHLRKFPQEAREKMYAIIKHRMAYHRYHSMLPLLDHDIGQLEERIGNRGDQARELQARILSGKGDKVGNKAKRDRLLSENTEEGIILDRARCLRREYEVSTNTAFNRANLLRIDLARGCPSLDIEGFKEFEKVIGERERLKAVFFHANQWTRILLDPAVQDAFDAILRAAVPPPISFGTWICNLFRGLCYSKK